MIADNLLNIKSKYKNLYSHVRNRENSRIVVVLRAFAMLLACLICLNNTVLQGGERSGEVQEESFEFVVLSDTHLCESGSPVRYSLYRATEEILDDIFAGPEPDFVIHLGDMINAGPRTDVGQIKVMWDVFIRGVRDRFREKNIPFLVLPGNHDVAGRAREIYRELWKNQFCEPLRMLSGQPESSYAFSYKNCLFICLDDSGTVLKKDEVRWLEQVLKEERAGHRHVFLLLHVGLLSSRRHPSERLKTPLFDLLEKYDVRFLISGHFHVARLDFLEEIPSDQRVVEKEPAPSGLIKAQACRKNKEVKVTGGARGHFEREGGKELTGALPLKQTEKQAIKKERQFFELVKKDNPAPEIEKGISDMPDRELPGESVCRRECGYRLAHFIAGSAGETPPYYYMRFRVEGDIVKYMYLKPGQKK